MIISFLIIICSVTIKRLYIPFSFLYGRIIHPLSFKVCHKFSLNVKDLPQLLSGVGSIPTTIVFLNTTFLSLGLIMSDPSV